MLCSLLVLACSLLTPNVMLHDFRDITLWRPNPDGGLAVATAADPAGGMRLKYVDGPPHWGNLTGPCRVPPEAIALKFRLIKHSSAPQAAMHIWLFEPDGDAWAQQVTIGSKTVGELAAGAYTARMPVSNFVFEPRGRRTRQMTTVDRMLLGCNYGDLEVTVDSMVWETRDGGHSAELPRTPGLKASRGEKGSVGVLDLGAALPDGFRTAHPPAKMAAALRRLGYGAALLKAGDFADPQVLNHATFDAVVMTYGPYFPAAARDAFLAYLKSGGSFLSTDGYAFDKPILWNGAGWVEQSAGIAAAEMDHPGGGEAPMNTRFGRPGDAMTFTSDQIGIFDPQFRIEGAVGIRPADRPPAVAASLSPIPGENVPARSDRFPKDWGPGGRKLTGFAACALIGDNNPVFPPVYRRWVPVLEAVDSAGRPRGAALAIVLNYAGPYRGSVWAFSGITSGVNLLAADSDQRGDPRDRAYRVGLLDGVMREICEKTYLHDLTTDRASYRPGEQAVVSVQVSNLGKHARKLRLQFLLPGGSSANIRTLNLAAGATQTATARVPITETTAAFCSVGAVLLDQHDSMSGGFCVWHEKSVAAGPQIGWNGNYLTVDGRPQFLAGTNQTGMMFYSPHENPAVWDRDFAEMAAHNIHILRILHFSPFAAKGYEGAASHGPLDLRNRPEKLCRQMDAIVQLAMKHRVALFLSLHDWQNLALTDEELAAQADWDRFWAARYKDVPGIFFDVQNEPSVDVPDSPHVRALWNRFLKERYGNDEALEGAWRRNPPEAKLSDVPLGKRTDQWDDVRSADLKRFEARMLNRWIESNVAGVKAGNPHALVTVGFLPSMSPADKLLGTRLTDFSNMHYYGSLEGLPLELKLIDRRAYGKGFSLGEFGAQEAHDARTRGSDEVPVAASVRRYDATLHYAAGLGAAFVATWDWKEFEEMVFPWGMVQRGEHVAKPWLDTLTQGSLLLSLLQPEYQSPDVFLLMPDSHRIGPRFEEVQRALHRAVGLLLDQRVNFGVLNEESLAAPEPITGSPDRPVAQQPNDPRTRPPVGIPASAKGVVWPIPYCPADPAFQRVLEWVRSGGTLYLSGGVAFDRERRPTRTDRLRELGLPEAVSPPPFETPDSAFGQPVAETTVGKGRVYFVPYPLELRQRAQDHGVYSRFLEVAGVARVRIKPQDAQVRAMSAPLKDGGRLYTLIRTDQGSSRLHVALPDVGAAVDLAEGGCAFVAVGPKGELIAAESDGEILVGAEKVAAADGHFGLAALDGLDLRRSHRLLVLPHQQPAVIVTRAVGGELRWSTGRPGGAPGGPARKGASCRFLNGEVGVLASVSDQKAAWEDVGRRLSMR